MNKLKDKIKNSYFIVNKIYLFLFFLFFSIENLLLGIVYFFVSIFIFILKILKSKLPLDTDMDIPIKTYVYKETEKKELKVDTYIPHNLKNPNLIYFCHGGGWVSGFRNQPNNVSWCKYLASKGFLVASIDYRYGFNNNMDDILSDYTHGLEFLKGNNEIQFNRDKIVLMGLSAGGHLALLYSSYNSFMENSIKMSGIQSVVAYYPPSILEDIFTDNNKSLFARFGIAQTLKGVPTDSLEIYKYYSPYTWISEKMIPTLLVHGKEDEVVPFKSSVSLIKKLKSFKINSDFLVHNTGKHSFDTKLKDYNTVNIIEKTLRFIKKSTS